MAFPLDSQFIDAAQQSIGVRFPRPYVEFMRATNGGTTRDDRWLLHPILDTSDQRRLKRSCAHVVRETEAARQYEGFPKGAVVIGENLEHVLLLLLRDATHPNQLGNAVYAWHPFHQDLDKVVDDFSDFEPQDQKSL